jgi:phage terminase small subunit
MSPKLQKVCNFYLKGMSMRESLIKGGYSDSYASHNSSKFLHNRQVQRYIRERQQEEAKAELANAIMIKNKLVALTEHSDPYVALNALKQLDAHNEWMAELEAKFKALEVAKESIQTPQQLEVTYNVVKKDN